MAQTAPIPDYLTLISVFTEISTNPDLSYTSYLEQLSELKLEELIHQLRHLHSPQGEIKQLGEGIRATLSNTAHLTPEELAALKVNRREKATAIAQMFHVITTSTLGLGSAVLGFLALSNPVTAFALAGLCAVSAVPSAILIRTSLDLLRNTQKQAFEKAVLAKLILEAQSVLNLHKRNRIELQLTALDKQVKDLLGEKQYLELRGKFEYLEDLYLSHQGIAALQTTIAANKRSIGKEKLTLLLRSLTEIKKEEPKYSALKPLGITFLTTPGNFDESKILRPYKLVNSSDLVLQDYNFRKWYKTNWNPVKQTGMPSVFGTTAGSMVFPGFLIALAATKVTTLSVLGLGAFVSAMTGPIGLGITLGVVVFVGLTIAGLSLYSRYRNDKRSMIKEAMSSDILCEHEKKDDYIKDEKIIEQLSRTIKKIQKVFNNGQSEKTKPTLDSTASSIGENRYSFHSASTTEDHRTSYERQSSPPLMEAPDYLPSPQNH